MLAFLNDFFEEVEVESCSETDKSEPKQARPDPLGSDALCSSERHRADRIPLASLG
jgi:hypothetical protein